MLFARKAPQLVVALALLLAAGAPIEGQTPDDGGGGSGGGLTCGWCVLDYRPRAGGVGLDRGHKFLVEGGDECGWEGHDYPGWLWCSRCGGESECHEEFQPPGYCHIICGPAGDAVAAATEIEQALRDRDMTVVASALMRERTGFSVEFIPEAGRIDVVMACYPNKALRTIPVLPQERKSVEYELLKLQATLATTQ